MRYITIFLILSLFVYSCEQSTKESLILIQKKTISAVPSASGLVVYNKYYWMVGDDSKELYKLSQDMEVENQIQISLLNTLVDGRVEKSIKADFEAMDLITASDLLILGSGSKSPSRDTAILFDLKEEKVRWKASMKPLYHQFLLMGKFDSLQSINIEGLASDSNFVYFLNRGNVCGKNYIFRIPKDAFVNYLFFGQIPSIEAFLFDLPKIDGVFSGFSGACITPDQQHLIFTCSVEATVDVYSDGEILGSYVGLIPLRGPDALRSQKSFLVHEKGVPIKTKLESVFVAHQEHSSFELVAVSDEDNGTSGVFSFSLMLNNP
jgi:hypothetical protein